MALVWSSLGCSSSGDGNNEAGEGSAATQPAAGKVADGTPFAKTIETYARWLPGDSLVVGVIDVESATSMVLAMYGMGAGVANPKVKEHQDAMRADLSALSKERLGMDVTGAKTLVFGVGLLGPSVVVVGPEVSAQDMEDVDGVKAFKVVPRHEADEADLGQLPYTPWAMQLPDKTGVVLFPNKERLAAIAGLDTISLAKSDRLADYTSMLGKMSGPFGLAGDLAFATNAANLAKGDGPSIKDQLGFEPPKHVAMSMGVKTTVRMKGDPKQLDILEEKRKAFIAEALAEIKPRYDARATENSALAATSIMGLHGLRSLDAMLEVERDGELLTYSIEGASLFSGAAGMGVVAAVAVPAFLRSIKKSKASEAEMMTTIIATSLVTEYLKTCSWPAPASTMAQVPTGGGKARADYSNPIWAKLGVTGDEEQYFAYDIGPGKGGISDYVVRARADFDAGGPVHTVEIGLKASKSGGECMATANPTLTTNEFE